MRAHLCSQNRKQKQEKTTLAFIRQDGKGLQNMAVLEFRHDARLKTARAVRTALELAVTTWCRRSDTGKRAWEYSCGSLNIGDLLGVIDDEMGDPELNACLEARGSTGCSLVMCYNDGSHAVVEYDHVLCKGIR